MPQMASRPGRTAQWKPSRRRWTFQCVDGKSGRSCRGLLCGVSDASFRDSPTYEPRAGTINDEAAFHTEQLSSTPYSAYSIRTDCT